MGRLPTPGGDAGAWGTILNDFLSQSHGADGTLKSNTVGNAQIIAVSQSKITGLEAALDAKANKIGATFSRGVTLLDPEPVTIVLWRATLQCAVTKITAYRTGGSGITINVRKNDTILLLATDLSISTADNWNDAGSLQNTSIASGDSLEIMVTAVSGSPTQLAVQIDLETV